MDKVCQFESRETIAHEAREWLVRLDGDELLGEQEQQALQLWAARSPAHKQELVRVAEFWDSSNILTELLVPMHQVAIATRRSENRRGLVGRLLTTTGGGAVMAMSVLLAVFTLRGLWLPAPVDATNGIYAAAIGELREETLADGSVLQINTDSQVLVEYSEQRRKIRLLRGEAHFEVTHNSEWPFEVYAGKAMVKAVGTAFLVRLEAQQLSVIVTDGRVDIAASKAVESAKLQSQSGSIGLQDTVAELERLGSLAEGEGVSFNEAINPKAQQLLAQKDMERQLSWREGYLVFEGEPLAVVVSELNRYLPMQVEIADDVLSDIPIGGRFKVGELEALFDVLESSFNVRVSRLDDRHIKLFAKPPQLK